MPPKKARQKKGEGPAAELVKAGLKLIAPKILEEVGAKIGQYAAEGIGYLRGKTGLGYNVAARTGSGYNMPSRRAGRGFKLASKASNQTFNRPLNYADTGYNEFGNATSNKMGSGKVYGPHRSINHRLMLSS
jgi:hypothetical protein